MEFSRQLIVQDVVIDEQSVMTLFKIVIQQWPSRRENKWDHVFDCTIKYYDESKVSFDDVPKHLEDYFDKPVLGLRFRIRSRLKSGSREIALALNHGDVGSTTTVIDLTGEEESWVNGVYTEFSDWLRHAKPQVTFFHRRVFWLLQLLAPPFGYVMLTTWYSVTKAMESGKVPPPEASAEGWTPAKVAMLIATIWIAGFFPAAMLLEQLKSLWPRVELNLGPRHMLKHIVTRKRWEVAAVIIVLPVVGNFIYDMVKLIFSA